MSKSEISGVFVGFIFCFCTTYLVQHDYMVRCSFHYYNLQEIAFHLQMNVKTKYFLQDIPRLVRSYKAKAPPRILCWIMTHPANHKSKVNIKYS